MDYEAQQVRLRALLESVSEEDRISPEPTQFDDDVDEDEMDLPDHVETRNEDSESEQELDRDCEFDDRTPNASYYSGKDGTKWKKHCVQKNIRTRSKNIVTQLPGAKQEVRGLTQPIEIWRKCVDTYMIDLIVKHTNEQIIINSNRHYSRDTYTRPTTNVEIEALMGLLILSGVQKSNRLNAEELFSTDGSSPEMFRLCMSLQRFLFLLRHLRFDDKSTRAQRTDVDKLAPIRDLFDKFVSNCKSNYSVSQYVTVDEKLEGFRGRCSFRQYIPSKPNKYGLKVYALCDAKMFYTANLEVYVGSQPPGPFAVSNSPHEVVKRMCEPIFGTNRNVTTDNWFTSIDLCEDLADNYGLTLLGTLRKNKRQIPPELIQGSRPVPSSIFAFGKKCTMVSMVPKRNKNVLVISSMHDDDSMDDVTEKPQMIVDYNHTKIGVDVVDQLCTNYNCARNTRRWPMVLFYSILNISGINTQIIFCANNPVTNVVRRKFLTNLAKALLKDHLVVRAQCTYLPRLTRERLMQICNIEEPEIAPRPEGTIGRCKECGSKKNRKTKYFCQKCSTFLCLEHARLLCKNCIG